LSSSPGTHGIDSMRLPLKLGTTTETEDITLILLFGVKKPVSSGKIGTLITVADDVINVAELVALVQSGRHQYLVQYQLSLSRLRSHKLVCRKSVAHPGNALPASENSEKHQALRF